jgi:toxin-antitoxin system PIN domain toxin
MSRVALLDVNLLVALFDPDHIHHTLAHDWFADHRSAGWATCATTENGFVRVLANPHYGAGTRAADLITRLRRFCSSGGHIFWRDAVSIRDDRLFRPSLIRGHRQLTEVYLLGLAVKQGGCLATFDRTILSSAVIGATKQSLAVISGDLGREPHQTSLEDPHRRSQR